MHVLQLPPCAMWIVPITNWIFYVPVSIMMPAVRSRKLTRDWHKVVYSPAVPYQTLETPGHTCTHIITYYFFVFSRQYLHPTSRTAQLATGTSSYLQCGFWSKWRTEVCACLFWLINSSSSSCSVRRCRWLQSRKFLDFVIYYNTLTTALPNGGLMPETSRSFHYWQLAPK